MIYLYEIFWRLSWNVCTLDQFGFGISSMSLSLLFGLLSYWNLANIGITQVPDEISFWNFLEAFLECLYTQSKLFGIVCMSVSLLVGLLPYWFRLIYRYLGFWMRYLSEIFLRHSQDISGLFTDHFEFLVCLSVC